MSEGKEGSQHGEDGKGAPQSIAKEEYDALQEKLDNAISQVNHFNKMFKGIDPEEFHAMKAIIRNQQEEAAKGGDPKALDEYKESLDKEYGAKITERDSHIEKLSKEVKELRVTGVAMQKAALVIRPDSLDLVKGMIDSELDYVDGEIVVKGPDGKPRKSAETPTKLMTIDEYLAGIAAKFPAIALPKGKSGAEDQGDKGSAGRAAEARFEQYKKASREEKLSNFTNIEKAEFSKRLLKA